MTSQDTTTAGPATLPKSSARNVARIIDRWVWIGIAGLILAFLYMPIAVLVAYSFNDSRSLSWPMSGFTLDWYRKLAENEQLIVAVQNSLYVAVCATSSDSRHRRSGGAGARPVVVPRQRRFSKARASSDRLARDHYRYFHADPVPTHRVWPEP